MTEENCKEEVWYRKNERKNEESDREREKTDWCELWKEIRDKEL